MTSMTFSGIPDLLIQLQLVNVNPDTLISNWPLIGPDQAYVFNPLCVAAPLAKNKASIYVMLCALLIMTEPSIVMDIRYVSAAN